MKYHTFSKGFTLIEVVIYIAVLGLSLAAIVTSVIAITRSQSRIQLDERIQQAANTTLERLVREIREAESIDAVDSVFDTSPGRLVIAVPQDGMAAREVEFILLNGVLQLKEEGTYIGDLIGSDVVVDTLIFRSIMTPHSEAVRIELTLSASSSQQTSTQSFYTTTVLRNSYE